MRVDPDAGIIESSALWWVLPAPVASPCTQGSLVALLLGHLNPEHCVPRRDVF